MERDKISRRKFLKGGAVLGTAVGLSSMTKADDKKDFAKAVGVKELDEFPLEVLTEAEGFKRYDQKNIAFVREIWDPEMKKILKGLPGYGNVTDNKKPGFTHLDQALFNGARAVNEKFAPGSAGGQANTPLYTWEEKPNEEKYQFSSKEDATKAIKKAAKFYGGDLVGITPYDERWVYNPMWSYSENRDVYDTEFPFKPKSVIVIALEMNYEVMGSAPSRLEEAATALIYSKMAEVNYKLSTFIRHLGYQAFGAGNDVAESIPYAIAAGLGESGRNNLLITYEYGPRVRLTKVFTEMELVYDKPIEFGANKFCQVCKKCATTCPSKSITTEDEMFWEPRSNSNHAGIKKYYLNVETCYEYWNTIGNDCGSCIASCPYNKPDFWHHRITTALTATPLKPFLNEMDDFFGYGNVFDEEVARNFWGLETYAK